MSIKKKLGMGVASAALGIALVGGGTFAYFSDTETSANTFAAGTLDLAVNPNVIVNLDKLKPGDTIQKNFKLENNGSLDISRVILKTDYTVDDAKEDNGEDFGKHIRVDFIINKDKATEVVKTSTLADLKDSNLVDRDLIGWILGGESPGLKAGTSDNLVVKFTFVDNKKDQNQFQGDKLNLNWTFNAEQTKGDSR